VSYLTDPGGKRSGKDGTVEREVEERKRRFE
jgi:hypothetical protein